MAVDGVIATLGPANITRLEVHNSVPNIARAYQVAPRHAGQITPRLGRVPVPAWVVGVDPCEHGRAIMRCAFLCSLVIGLVTGCGSDHTTITAQDEAAIREVLERQEAAWNRGDIRGFMEGYHRSPDTIFTSGAKVRRGWDATLAAYETKYVEGNAMGTLDLTGFEIQTVGADGAVVLGRFILTETPQASSGVFSLVFARHGQTWGIVHDHSSAEVAAP